MLDDGTSDAVAASVNSSLNLYRGGSDLAAQRSAAAALAADRYTLRRSEQDLFLEISSAFMQALTDRDLIAVEQENVEANRQLEERIAALVKAGVSPVSYLYQQQAATAWLPSTPSPAPDTPGFSFRKRQGSIRSTRLWACDET